MKKLFSLIIFLNVLTFVHAQQTPEIIVKSFFKDYASEGPSIALDNLYSNNKWIMRSADAISTLKTQLGSMDKAVIGNYNGHELIVEKKLTESYILMSYMVKFDRQPLRFTFQFYKPKDQWITYSFKFDSNIDDEIEEAAKLYYLKFFY